MHESEKWKWICSVVSNSSWFHGLQPTRLLHPWDFPGKSTGVGCHCLLRQRSLVGHNSQGHKELETIEQLNTYTQLTKKQIQAGNKCLFAGSRRETFHSWQRSEGGSAYSKSGSSLRSSPGYSRASTPQKPKSAFFIALYSHLWLYWGLYPTTISLSLSKS